MPDCMAEGSAGSTRLMAVRGGAKTDQHPGPDQLLTQVGWLIQSRFGYYHAQIFLVVEVRKEKLPRPPQVFVLQPAL